MTTRRPLSDEELLRGLGAAFSHMGSMLDVPDELSPEQMMKRTQPLPLPARRHPWVKQVVPTAAVLLLAVFAVYFMHVLGNGDITADTDSTAGNAAPQSSLAISAREMEEGAQWDAAASESSTAVTQEDYETAEDSLDGASVTTSSSPYSQMGGPYTASDMQDIYFNLQSAVANVHSASKASLDGADGPEINPNVGGGGDEGDAGISTPDAGSGDASSQIAPPLGGGGYTVNENSSSSASTESNDAHINPSFGNGSPNSLGAPLPELYTEDGPPPIVQSKIADAAMIPASTEVSSNGSSYRIEEESVWMVPETSTAKAMALQDLSTSASGLLTIEDRLIVVSSDGEETTIDILQTFEGGTEPETLATYSLEGYAVETALCDGKLIVLLQYAVQEDLITESNLEVEPDKLLPTLSVDGEVYSLPPEKITILPDGLLPGYLVCAIIDPTADNLTTLDASAVLGSAGPVLITADSLYVTHLASDGETTWIARFSLQDGISYDSYTLVSGQILHADQLGVLENGLIVTITEMGIGVYSSTLTWITDVDPGALSPDMSVEIEGNNVRLIDPDGNLTEIGLEDPQAPTIACGVSKAD